jgi:serine/threonine protein phosphatase PrpC
VVAERRVLLCTDGLYTAVAEQTLQDIVCDPAARPAEIVSRLLAAAGEAAGDDVTALVAQVNVIDKQQTGASAPGDPPAQRRWFAMRRGG